MNFIETRGNDGARPSAISFSSAILNPMASFGGLFLPEYLPDLDIAFLQKHLEADYKTLARDILSAFELDVDQAVIDEALTLDSADSECGVMYAPNTSTHPFAPLLLC